MEVLKDLETQIVGRNTIYYEEIDSTQLEAWRQIEKDTLPNGTLILADKQTKGKRNTWKKVVHGKERKYCPFFGIRSGL